VSAPLDAGAVQASGLPAGGAAVRAVGLGAAGAAWVLLADGQADTIAGPGPGPGAGAGAGWHALPTPPGDTAALAFAPSGGVDALAAHASTFTDWRLPAGGTAWRRLQSLYVPVQYGSSS